MPDFNKRVFFPGQKYRGELSAQNKNDNIVYVEFVNEVKAYDNIKYPGSYVNKIIGHINKTDNEENVLAVWQGNYCAWKKPYWQEEEPKKPEPKRPDPTEADDLPF